MFFIILLISFLVLLVMVCITNLFLSASIKLVTNNSLEEFKFILPSILSLIITGLTFLLIYLIDINMLGLSIKESIMAFVFKTVDLTSKLKYMILIDVVILILSILIQSLCLITVNIDYTVMKGRIRMFFKDIIKKISKNKKVSKKADNTENTDDKVDTTLDKNEEIDSENYKNPNLVAVIPEGEMAENKERLKLSIPNAIICTLFIFSFQFFMFMALFTVGATLANKII